MEQLFLSIEYKDPIWIAVAFLFGIGGRWIGLPPLVGFLVAGFALNYMGAEGGEFLNEMADLGVTLLLFTIGLKLRIKELIRPEIWGVSLIHTVSISLLSTLGILALKTLGIPLFKELSLVGSIILGFALSFSSTVFVVKTLESRGEFLSQYGKIAIGVLIVQDIAAVIFLGVSEAKLPSAWAALVIVALIVGRPLLIKVLNRTGHGELLVLFGLVLALGGASLFETVDMKADLGALVFGVLLASSTKAEELAKSLISIKELFLVGFFLSIGMAGLPNLKILLAVCILLLMLPIKTFLFHWLFSLFRVRTRSSIAASLSLGNYSEFGLIVAAVAVTQKWLANDWLIGMAVGVSASFAISSVISNNSDKIYTRFRPQLRRFQSRKRLPGDEDINLDGIRILVCGMGRVGRGAIDHLVLHGEKDIVGLDYDSNIVKQQCEEGRDTRQADVSSPDFWYRLDVANSNIEWVLLCTPNLHSNVKTAQLARTHGFKGLISASARFPEDESVLKEAGVDAVFNIFAEAGAGLAQHGQEFLEKEPGLVSKPI